jgi:muramoyltetrapeptide carboxypeptidase
MIYQLHLTGILARQQALVLGDFSGSKQFDYDNGYDLREMVEQVRSVVGIPVLTGLPFGHIPDMVTLPMGAPAQLNSTAHGFELTMSGYPHLG